MAVLEAWAAGLQMESGQQGSRQVSDPGSTMKTDRGEISPRATQHLRQSYLKEKPDCFPSLVDEQIAL